MLEIPLLLAVNPRVANPSVRIPIEFDRWQVRVEGLVDSELTLHSDGPFKNRVKVTLPTINGAVYMGPCEVRVEFEKRGTEKSISVFAFGVK